MSKVSISGDQNGTGNFTIKAPNSNSDRTLNLPDEAGTVLTNVSDISAANLTGDVAAERITGALNATGTAPVYACRAWVNFDGENTTIRESGNVSSVTDRGTGQYTINFNNSMPDSNYSLVGSARGEDGLLDNRPSNFGVDSFSTSGGEVSVTRNKSGTSEDDQFFDTALITTAVFR